MYKQLLYLILSLGLMSNAHADTIVQDNFTEDPSNPMQMSVHHAGNSMQALCPPASVGDDSDAPCPIVIKNKAGKTLTIQGLNADEANTAEVVWLANSAVQVIVSLQQTDVMYSILINFKAMQIQYITNLFTADPSKDLMALANAGDKAKIIVTRMSNLTQGLLIDTPKNAMSPNAYESVHYSSYFDNQGSFILRFINKKNVISTQVIPINPSQFAPINPSDIGTFDIKTLNANSGTS